jgi:hypothetical protein
MAAHDTQRALSGMGWDGIGWDGAGGDGEGSERQCHLSADGSTPARQPARTRPCLLEIARGAAEQMLESASMCQRRSGCRAGHHPLVSTQRFLAPH